MLTVINNEKIEPALYIVPTPIGNLEDITFRALRILKNADIIACEDTRTSGKLFRLLGITPKKLIAYHDFNEKVQSEKLIAEIKNNKSVALITDAGTPGISDPAYSVVQSAISNNIKIVPLPGPTAFVPALIASGLPVHNFTFLGFPPQKKGRKTFLENASKIKSTIILYESPHRIVKLAAELIEFFGAGRQACFCREISKIFEEFIRGTLAECLDLLKNNIVIKGEFVVVICGLS